MTREEWDTAGKLFRICEAIEQLPIQLRGEVYANETLKAEYNAAKRHLKKYKKGIRDSITVALSQAHLNSRGQLNEDIADINKRITTSK